MSKPGAVGSVPGHAPTNPRGNLASLPKTDLVPHQFGQPTSVSRRDGNGRPATAAQRHCMEAIERLEDLDDEKEIERLCRRFRPRMVLRLIELQKAAEDFGNPFFLQAQRQIYTITIAPVRKDEKADDAAAREAEVIEVRVGRVEVPMPGAPGDVPPADAKAS